MKMGVKCRISLLEPNSSKTSKEKSCRNERKSIMLDLGMRIHLERRREKIERVGHVRKKWLDHGFIYVLSFL